MKSIGRSTTCCPSVQNRSPGIDSYLHEAVSTTRFTSSSFTCTPLLYPLQHIRDSRHRTTAGNANDSACRQQSTAEQRSQLERRHTFPWDSGTERQDTRQARDSRVIGSLDGRRHRARPPTLQHILSENRRVRPPPVRRGVLVARRF